MYTLIDAIELNKLHPTTFEVPTAYEITQISTGDNVKLCFAEEGQTNERMWVEVTYVDIDKGIFVGTLNNDPLGIESLNYGDIVDFKPLNIYSILKNNV